MAYGPKIKPIDKAKNRKAALALVGLKRMPREGTAKRAWVEWFAANLPPDTLARLNNGDSEFRNKANARAAVNPMAAAR